MSFYITIKSCPYYHDDQLNYSPLKKLPKIVIDVSHIINYVTLLDISNET